MIRPALLLLFLPALAWAQPLTLGAPRSAEAAAPCENTRDSENCSRVLACIGEDGLWFDGRADGWNHGTLSGRMSDGAACTGAWRYARSGPTATAELACDDGRAGAVDYVAQDPETGTGIGRGRMDDGAAITAWTGRNVLRFLTPEGERHALLPCQGGPIPIS